MLAALAMESLSLESLPFSERREVLGTVPVTVPFTAIQPFDLHYEARDCFITVPLPVGRVCVHHRQAVDVNKDYRCIVMAVHEVADDADVVIRGELRWKTRNNVDTGLSASGGWAGASTTWLRGNGRLGALLRCHTYEVAAAVTVYGPPLDRAPSTAVLRPLAAFSDVVLRAAGATFPAHRVLLAARSPVFLAMFTGDFREAHSSTGAGVVDVAVDCSADVFGAFVDFLYSGALGERTFADVLDLLELGERYMVAELKQECVRRLMGVRPEAAFAVFRAALEKPFVPSDVRLRAAQVVRNNWLAISASDDWLTFSAEQPVFALMMESILTGLTASD